MSTRYFFEKDKVADRLYFTTTSDLDSYDTDNELIEITESEVDGKYSDYIQWISCCYFDKNNEIQIDITKLLAEKLKFIQDEIDEEIVNLRNIIREAATLDKPEVAREASGIIKTLNTFIDSSDFSNLKTIYDVNDIIVPELSINYEEYFFEKLYIL